MIISTEAGRFSLNSYRPNRLTPLPTKDAEAEENQIVALSTRQVSSLRSAGALAVQASINAHFAANLLARD